MAGARGRLARAWVPTLRQEKGAKRVHRAPPGRGRHFGLLSTGFTRGYFHPVPPGRVPAVRQTTCGGANRSLFARTGLGAFRVNRYTLRITASERGKKPWR